MASNGSNDHQHRHDRFDNIQAWPATRSSISSTISPAPAATFSCTTTASGRAVTPTRRSAAPRAGLRRASAGSASARATRWCSGVKTARSGSSRSGDACSTAWSWFRSTIAPRRNFSPGSSGSSRPDSCSSVRTCRRSRSTARTSGSCTSSTGIRRAQPLAGSGDRAAADHSREAAPPGGRPRRRRRDHLHVGRDRRAQRRGHHASERPGEHRAGRARSAQIPALGAALLPAPLPESAAVEPHVRTGDGDVHPADAARHGACSCAATTRPTSSRRSGRGGCPCSSRCPRFSTCCASTCCGWRRKRRRRGRSSTSRSAGGGTGTSIGCSGSSSGASSSAPRRSNRSSKRSGRELGFVVIQGYGLTETAPIVSLNHPFGTRKGSVGKAMAGVEVKIAADGEILVRGENVTTGYFNAADETARAFEDGWFHTGDVGEVAADGQMFIRGRKKEMIVTPEGLNVFPEDVERALQHVAGVRDSAVVGIATGGEERVHAVLVVDPGVDPDAVVRAANAELDDHQKIRRAVIWPEPELPRTEGTRKLKRAAIREWLRTGAAPRAAASDGRQAERAGGEVRGPRGSGVDDHARGAGLELARTRGADGRARGCISDASGRRRVCRRSRRGAAAHAGRGRGHRRHAAARSGGFPDLEPIARGAGGPPHQPADLDPAARPRVRLAARSRVSSISGRSADR